MTFIPLIEKICFLIMVVWGVIVLILFLGLFDCNFFTWCTNLISYFSQLLFSFPLYWVIFSDWFTASNLSLKHCKVIVLGMCSWHFVRYRDSYFGNVCCIFTFFVTLTRKWMKFFNEACLFSIILYRYNVHVQSILWVTVLLWLFIILFFLSLLQVD